MKYYVVISITHSTIAFHYYRDDSNDRRLRTFDGTWPAPLAVYCHGSQIEIGEDAAVAARRGVEGAFTDIFSLARTEGFFDYNGTKYSYEKLLFHAIEYYLKRFLKTTLFSRAGDLEANRAGMSLFLNFGPDISAEERDYVMELLRAGGYGNLREVDYNRIAINSIQRRIRHNNVLMMMADGKDLYCTAYSTREYSHEQPRRECLRGKGCDPRLMKAVEIIKGDIRKDNAWVEFTEVDLRRIEEEARAFIESGKVSSSVRISLSDGSSSQAYLTKNAISLGTDADLRTRLRIMLDEMGLAPESTTVILKGEDTCNDFFRSQLNPFFGDLLEIRGDVQDIVRDSILDHIISAGSEPVTVAKTAVRATSGTPVVSEPVPADEKYRYWSREKRIRLAEAKAKARQPNFNYKAAIEMVETLLEGLKIAGINEYNDELNHQIDEWKSVLVMADDLKPKRVNKDTLLDSVRKADDAVKKLNDSLGRESGAHTLRNKVPSPAAVKNMPPSPAPEAPRSTRADSAGAGRSGTPYVRPAVSPNASATQLMKAERFMEAKRKFAQERNSAMAELCTRLINVNRDVSRIRSQAGMASGREFASRALATLNNARALYVQAGIDTAALDDLILKFSNL